jgi:rare lipoprotein A (peptidoglycan hydrolase)
MIRCLRPLALTAALTLSGCETIDWNPSANTGTPSVSVNPLGQLASLGLVRSGETFSGTTSWYSVRTNGGTRTASGEKFSDHGDTAAHRHLPFGTMIEVTNLANDRSVILRVNDRGPYTKGRVLDVSIGAAKKLGFDKRGITNCRVEILRPAGSVLAASEGSKPEGGQ